MALLSSIWRSALLSELRASSRPEAVEAHGHTDLYNSWKKADFYHLHPEVQILIILLKVRPDIGKG